MKGMGLKNNINAYSCHVVSSCETRYLAPEFRPMRSYKIRPEYSQRRLRSGPCLGACIEILSVSLFNRRAPHSVSIFDMESLSSGPINFHVLFSWGGMYRHQGCGHWYSPPI
jgi:hypothetical protein